MKSFEGQVNELYESVIDLIYYMRGAVSKEEVLEMTPWERTKFGEYIRERLEVELKKANPIY